MPLSRNNNNAQQLKTIQPLYLAQANVFVFDAQKSRSWIPLKEQEVPISILYDENRAIYRIISMDLSAEPSKKVLVNSTILPCLEFHKTSATFGHWTDKSTGKIYGIGFQSQFELDAFEDSLKKAQSAIYTLVKGSGSAKQQQPNGEEEVPKNCIYPSGANYKNWSQLLNHVKKTHAKVPTILIPEAAPPISNRCEDSKIPAPHQGQGEAVPSFSAKTFTIHGHTSSITLPENPKLYSELQTLRQEHETLKEVSVESCTNAKKWEFQIDTIQGDNASLIARMDQASTELQELNRQEADFKSALVKWQECIAKNTGKVVNIKETEQQVRFLAEENMRLERRLEQVRQRLVQRQSDSKVLSVGPDDLVRLENYYKKLLESTTKNAEEVNAANLEGKKVFQRIDYMFAKTIRELIAIHAQISQTSK